MTQMTQTTSVDLHVCIVHVRCVLYMQPDMYTCITHAQICASVLLSQQMNQT